MGAATPGTGLVLTGSTHCCCEYFLYVLCNDWARETKSGDNGATPSLPRAERQTPCGTLLGAASVARAASRRAARRDTQPAAAPHCPSRAAHARQGHRQPLGAPLIIRQRSQSTKQRQQVKGHRRALSAPVVLHLAAPNTGIFLPSINHPQLSPSDKALSVPRLRASPHDNK